MKSRPPPLPPVYPSRMVNPLREEEEARLERLRQRGPAGGPVVGVTATQRGLTTAQKTAFRTHLERLRPEVVEHGDCIGGDEQIDAIALELGIHRHIRPCDIEGKRAHCHRRGGSYTLFPIEKPLVRNRLIVLASSIMLGGPGEMRGRPHSGTWSTINYCHKAKRRLVILFPDGSEREVCADGE